MAQYSKNEIKPHPTKIVKSLEIFVYLLPVPKMVSIFLLVPTYSTLSHCTEGLYRITWRGSNPS